MNRRIVFLLGLLFFMVGCGNGEVENKEIIETSSDYFAAKDEVTSEENRNEQTEYDSADKIEEITNLEEYNITDLNLKKSIQEHVQLKEGTEIEDVAWIDDEQTCMRVSIRYEEQPESLWYNHVEDYFFFIDEEIEVLYVDYPEPGSMERNVWEGPDFNAHLEDVNFDGNKDLIIYLGENGVLAGEQYCAYLYTEEGYEYCPSFEEICRYQVDYDNKQVISTMLYNSGDGNYIEIKENYIFINNTFQKIYDGVTTNEAINN